MNAAIPEDQGHAMQAVLERQRQADVKEGPPSAARRIDRIERAIALLRGHKDAIAEALRRDFGHRSVEASLMTDIAGAIGPLTFARDNLRHWMAPERRRVHPLPLGWLGARARVEFQPKGVVGVIAPWNFPVQLTFAPLAGIFAAGNRAMIKPSEYTPETSALLARMIGEAFDEVEAAVFTGGPEVGAAFAKLPFDHLLFTGATSVGVHVARAAAENLVPVTLELGGKSPVVIGRSADMALAARRILFGKTLNAGQICLAPDYVLVAKEQADKFADHAAAAVAGMYPTLKDNPDYTSVINARHYERLMGTLADARVKGGRIVELNPAREDFSQQPFHKIAPTLIMDPTPDMAAMQDEIFGPILPVVPYEDVSEAIAFIKARPRPLGLYYFGADVKEETRVLTHTISGGVSVNDVVMHVSMEDLPFGGIGPSGMGAYHGRDGFKTFSHAKAVFRQSPFDLTAMLRPPYGERFRKLVQGQIGR